MPAGSATSSSSADALIRERIEPLQAAARAAELYLEGVGARSVAPRAEAVAALDPLRGPLPLGPTRPDQVVDLLARVASPATVANGGGRFFGFVNGGSVPAAMAASWLVSAWDQNAAMRVQSPAAVTLEETALGWVCRLLGLPEGCGGAVVTGATMANFCGLAAARHALLERAGWDVENDGLFGAPPITVVIGDEAHSSLIKALGMLGLGRNRVVRVPVDGQGRMRADALPHLNENTLLCLQAGNVNTGSFDPADAICPRARDGAPGFTWTAPLGSGPLFPQVPASYPWIRTGRLMGDRRPQMAQHRLRLRHQPSAQPATAARSHGNSGGLSRAG